MRELIESSIILLINNLSNYIFNLSVEISNKMSNSIYNIEFGKIYISIFVLSLIATISLILYKSYAFFKIDKECYIENRYKIKRIAKNIIFVLIISLGYKEIINFTFGYLENIMGDGKIIDILKQNSYSVYNTTLYSTVVNSMSAGSSIIIALTKAIELISFKLTLMLSPIIIVGSLFFDKLTGEYIKAIAYVITNSIIQTGILYVVIEIFLPVVNINSAYSNLIVLIAIIQGFYISNIAIKLIPENIYKLFNRNRSLNIQL